MRIHVNEGELSEVGQTKRLDELGEVKLEVAEVKLGESYTGDQRKWIGKTRSTLTGSGGESLERNADSLQSQIHQARALRQQLWQFL